MAPSRGITTATKPHESTTTTRNPPHDSDAPNLARESSALARARLNFAYLLDPAHSSSQPTHLRVRLLLRSLHSLGVFLFWRVVRWAKYAVYGSLVAAVGGVAVFGSLASGVGFLVAPSGILASVAVGTAWGLGKWVWRRAWRRAERGREKGGEGVGGARGGGAGEGGGRTEERYVKEPELQAVPW